MSVREMQRSHELMDVVTLQPPLIDALGDDFADEVLAGARPAVQGQRQRLLGLGVAEEAPHGPDHHLADQVLPEQPSVQALLQRGGDALLVPLEAALPKVAVEPRVRDDAGKGRGGGPGDRQPQADGFHGPRWRREEQHALSAAGPLPYQQQR